MNDIAFKVSEKYLTSLYLQKIALLNKQNSKLLQKSLSLAKQCDVCLKVCVHTNAIVLHARLLMRN